MELKRESPMREIFHTLICLSAPHMTGKLANTMKGTFNNINREKEAQVIKY
jgi:hypothetical protein